MKTINRVLFLLLVATVFFWPTPPFLALPQAQSCAVSQFVGCFASESACQQGGGTAAPHDWCKAACCSPWNEGELAGNCFQDSTACPSPAARWKRELAASCVGACATCRELGASCTSGSQCCSGICNADLGVCDTSSPILINTRNNSADFNLTSAAEGVPFDITASGILRQVAWTSANSSIAFLVLDRNQNGQIDNGAELFGDATVLSNGRKARNGFEALQDLDRLHQGDGQIDAADQVFDDLRLWFDRNHNGFSESVELVSFETAGIVAIMTDYRESRRVDEHGNSYRYVGRAFAKERRRFTPRRVVDVFLKVVV